MKSTIAKVALGAGVAAVATWGVLRLANFTTVTNESLRLSDRTLRTLTKKAEQGDAEAANRVASHFFFGENDHKTGFEWMERAALLGREKSRMWIADYIRRRGLENYRMVLERTNAEAEQIFVKEAERMSFEAEK